MELDLRLLTDPGPGFLGVNPVNVKISKMYINKLPIQYNV